MSEIKRVPVDGVDYKVHPDGDVFKVTGSGILGGDTTLKVGRIPKDTPANKLADEIRKIIN